MKASVHPTITYLHREGKQREIMEVERNNPCDLYELLAVVILKTVDLLSLRTKSADVQRHQIFSARRHKRWCEDGDSSAQQSYYFKYVKRDG